MTFIKKLADLIENGINSLFNKCEDISKSVDESIANMEDDVIKISDTLADKKDFFCGSADKTKDLDVEISSNNEEIVETNLIEDLSCTQVCKTALSSNLVNKSSIKLSKD